MVHVLGHPTFSGRAPRIAGVGVKKSGGCRIAGCFPAGSGLPDQLTPSPIDAPWNYDDAGEPANQEIRERWEYLQSVTEAEERRKFDHMLSSVCDGMGRQ